MYKLIDNVRKFDSIGSVCINDNFLGYSDGNQIKLYELDTIGRINTSDPILEIKSNNTIIQSKLYNTSIYSLSRTRL